VGIDLHDKLVLVTDTTLNIRRGSVETHLYFPCQNFILRKNMPPKKNPLKLNLLQLKMLTISRDLLKAQYSMTAITSIAAMQ
jgi:hypothetical protein